MSTLLDLGARLAAARRARGISQREFGSHLGVHQQQVARWEAAEYRNASLERVAAAAAALGVEPDSSHADALPIAADPAAAYRPGPALVAPPVRDLGEIAARLRANGSTLRDEYGFGRIGVFGSFARGEQTVESDVDLLVEFADPRKIDGLRFMEAADHVEDLLGRRVDIIRPHLLKERLRPRVMEDVVYVWPS